MASMPISLMRANCAFTAGVSQKAPSVSSSDAAALGVLTSVYVEPPAANSPGGAHGLALLNPAKAPTGARVCVGSATGIVTSLEFTTWAGAQAGGVVEQEGTGTPADSARGTADEEAAAKKAAEAERKAAKLAAMEAKMRKLGLMK